jgi:hypothetical protein
LPRRSSLHEEAVPGLAIGRELGQHPGPFLGLAQRRAAKAEAGGGEALQPAQPDLLEPAPPQVDPGRLQPAEERSGGDVVGDAGRPPGLGPPSLGDGRLRPVGALQGRLDIDQGRRRHQQLDLGPPAEPVGAQAVAELGQGHAEGVARRDRGVLAPAGHEQLVPGHRPAPVEDQVGEQDPPSAAGQRVLDAAAVDLDDEATA